MGKTETSSGETLQTALSNPPPLPPCRLTAAPKCRFRLIPFCWTSYAESRTSINDSLLSRPQLREADPGRKRCHKTNSHPCQNEKRREERRSASQVRRASDFIKSLAHTA